jgi:hypothetical protein
VFENKILMKIYWPKKNEVHSFEYCKMMNFVSYTGEVLLRQLYQGGYDRLCMWLGWGMQGMHTDLGRETYWKMTTWIWENSIKMDITETGCNDR